MPVIPWVPGLPGFGSATTATPRLIFRQGDYTYLSSGKIINGTLSRDSGNTGDLGRLQPGLLMGMVTATGLYAPSILGVTTGAYASGGTSITVSAAQAVEIVRRVGSTGNLTYVGPPTANGTNAVTTSIAYSAVNTTTGVITTSSLGVDKVAGTLVTATDGTGVPVSLIGNGYPVGVTDASGNSVNVGWQMPIAGVILSANILPVWPSDTSIRAWIRTSLSSVSQGKFVFDDLYSA